MLSAALQHISDIEESTDSYLSHPHIVMALDTNPPLEDCRAMAMWTAVHNGKLDIVTLNIDDIEKIHTDLERYNYLAYVSLHRQDPMKFLLNTTFSPLVFINAPDEQTGSELFRLALSAGAQIILFGNFGMQAGAAIRQAKQLGMTVHQMFGRTHLISR